MCGCVYVLIIFVGVCMCWFCKVCVCVRIEFIFGCVYVLVL